MGVAAVLFLFALLSAFHFHSSVGEDLSSSYVGCRLLAAGESTHLYAHDPTVFSIVRDPVWNNIAQQANFAPLSLLHPYVQTPAWAFLLQPLCTRTGFRTFCHLFLVLVMLCTSGVLWLVARYWAPTLFHPLWMVLICLALWFSEPFRYSLFLTQTHMLFIFLTVLALVLAQKNRPVFAGLALALAAAVKITPGLLLLYWLVDRRYKAAFSFIVSSALLVGFTVATTGLSLFIAYLHELSRISNVLLIAFNNQSLAAWIMGKHYASSELFDWKILPLPSSVKWTSLLLSLLSAMIGGLMDRDTPQDLSRGIRRSPLHAAPQRPPYGAAFVLVGGTMFTAIAWSHYFVLLVIPVMLLLDALRRDGLAILWGTLAVAIYAFNLYPIAYGSISHLHQAHSLARSQFYSGALCLLALLLLRWLASDFTTLRRRPA